MGVQTSITTAPVRGMAGQIAEAGAPRYIVSGAIEATANAAAFGKLFVRGTADGQAKTIINGGTLTARNILGVGVYEPAREPSDLGDTRPISIMRRGIVYVTVSENVVAGQQATYGNTTGNLDEWGVTTDADHVPVPGARFAQTVASGGVARLEVDFGGAVEGMKIAAVFTYTSNDFAVTNPVHDSVYDVATTGAASTISLPATAPDGTRLHFVADGTKNGHTVTYRDVTTALTTALTASKVHGVTVVCRNNAWAVTGLYVSP